MAFTHLLRIIGSLGSEVFLDIETDITGGDHWKFHIPVVITVGTVNHQEVIEVKDYTRLQIRLFLLNLSKFTIVGHNLSYDMTVLCNFYALDITKYKLRDTMLGYICDNLGLDKSASLANVTRELVDPYAYTNQTNLFRPVVTKDIQKSFRVGEELTPAQITYAKLDVYNTARIDAILPRSEVWDLENSYLNVIVEMQLNGVCIDEEKWLEIDDEVILDLNKSRDELYDIAAINWNSPKQVKTVFKQHGVNINFLDSKTGELKESVNGKLLDLSNEVVAKYVRYKELSKLTSSYGRKFLTNVIDGRIHSSFWQIVSTGRTSSNAPNMQNIPVRKGEKHRTAIVPSKGCSFIIADYDNQELKIAAYKSNTPAWIKAFIEKRDVHAETASLIYGRAITKKDPERDQGKTINFTILYGGGKNKIKTVLKITAREAEALLNKFFDGAPELKHYLDTVRKRALETGEIIIDSFGRVHKLKRWKLYKELQKIRGSVSYWSLPKLEDLYSSIEAEIERFAANYPIQGEAGSMAKMAGILLLKASRIHNFKVLLLVHDEYVIEARTEDVEKVKVVVANCMKEAGTYFTKVLEMSASATVSDIWNK